MKLVSWAGFEEKLLDDLQALFKRVKFDDGGYLESDFELKTADEVDIQCYRGNPRSRIFTWYDKAKNMQKIYFSSAYFDCSSKIRLAYLFHEICHYMGYSFYPNSAKIVQIKGEICDEFNEQNKKRKLPRAEGISEIIINRCKYRYILSAVNEREADRLMIEIDEELYREKLIAQIKEYRDRAPKLDQAHDIFNHMIDVYRSIDLIKELKGYDEQIKGLNEIAEILRPNLDGKIMEEKVTILLNSIDKLRSLIGKSDATNILPFFEKLMRELGNFNSEFMEV